MKKLLLGICIAGISISVISQNLFQNGDMEEQGAWMVLSLENTIGDVNYSFGVALPPPEGASGNCFEADLTSDGINDAVSQIFVYQVLSLTGNHAYKFQAFIKDLSADLQNAWIEFLWVHPDSLPAENTGDLVADNLFCGFNYWIEGCSPGFNGNMALLTCDGTPASIDTVNGYVYFNIPDSMGGESIIGQNIDLAVGFAVGMYSPPSPILSFDVLVDELYLEDAGPLTSVGSVAASNEILLNTYPNPAGEIATISYNVPASGPVKITMYDVIGTEVATLVNAQMDAGNYKYEFNTSNLSNGTYICKFEVGDYVVTRKFTILK